MKIPLVPNAIYLMEVSKIYKVYITPAAASVAGYLRFWWVQISNGASRENPFTKSGKTRLMTSVENPSHWWLATIAKVSGLYFIPRLTMRLVERLVRLFERIFDRIDSWIDWYRNRQFRRYAIRQQSRGVDTFLIRTGVRSKTPSPIRNLAAFHSQMSEQRYYVEVDPVGWPGSYRQTIGPSFYGYLNEPMDSAGSRWRAEKGRERATTLLKEWKELLEELDFEVLEGEIQPP